MAASSSDIEIANWLIGPQLIVAIFILAALLQNRFPPKKINSLYGYRTPLSMKNQQNWDEGNRYSTQLMLKLGIILLLAGLAVTPVFLLLSTSLDAQMLIKVGLLIAGAISTVVILLTLTERHLQKTTDRSVMQYYTFGDEEQPAISPDEFFMNEALKEARQALAEDEIPIGAVVVCKGKIIGRGHNLTERLNDVSAHAEMQALTAAANYMGGKYLPECTLYVTLEPCVMCAGASYWFQIGRIVFGAYDTRMGFGRLNQSVTHPKTLITSGIHENECSQLIKDFFKGKRGK